MFFFKKAMVGRTRSLPAKLPFARRPQAAVDFHRIDMLEPRMLLSAYSFSDEFNGAVGSGPASAWGKGNAKDPNNAKVIYTNTTPAQATAQNPTTLQVVNDAQASDGKSLALSLMPDPAGTGNYFSSEITTQFDPSGAGNSLQYGHIEARIKLPGGNNSGAIWPAFWLLGDNIASVSWPACGEIDIMENDGAKPGINDSTLHGPASGGGDYNGGAGVGASYTLPGGASYYTSYHVFAADWGPSSVTFSVDGKPFYTMTPANLPGGATWVFNGHPFYMILDVCEGGLFAPGTITSTQTMYVDYIHASTFSAAASAPLTDQDIGSPAKAGSAYFDGVTRTLNGGGTDIWGTSDQFNFDSQAITGDATLITQVNWVGNTGQFAKGGLMIRDGTAANASYAFMELNPGNAGATGHGGASFEYRNGAGTATVSAGTVATANLQNGAIWLKLVRAGNVFTGYDSTDGSTWTQIGTSQSISMSPTVQAGLADDANNPGSISTDTFANLSILPGTFSDANIGSPLRPGMSGYTNSSATFTASGGGPGFTGVSDQFNYVSQPVTGDFSLIADVTSQNSVNTAAMAGAMLRDTSATNSAFAAVVVTPSSGVEFLWRTTTGGSVSSAFVAGKTVPIWLEITRIGNSFAAYYGTNGSTWTQIGTNQSITMGAAVRSGLTVTSGDLVTLNTTSFSAVQILAPGTITVSAPVSTINDGQTVQLTAVVKDQFGVAISPQPSNIAWSLDSGSVGSVSSSGLYTAPDSGPGTAAVRATYGGISSTASVTTLLSVINGSGAADTIRLARSGSSLNVFLNSASSIYTVPFPTLGAILVNGLGGNDTIIIDFSSGSSPIPASGIIVDGGTGTDAINVVGSTGNDSITVVDSTHLTVNGSSIVYANDESINVTGNGGNDTVTQAAQPGNAASLSFDGGTGDTLNVNVGTYTIPAGTAGGIFTYSLGTLSLGAGANVSIASAASHSNRSVLVLGNLVLAGNPDSWTATLNIGTNDVIVHNGNLAQLTNQISTGCNGSGSATWNGIGILTSTSNQLTALGVAINNDGKGNTIYGSGAPLGLFDGQNPSITDVLIKYTYWGDANLDGQVDGSDYSLIDFGFNSLTGWTNGDFNYDNLVDGSDYSLIDNAFNTQGSSLAAAMPIPASATPSASLALPIAMKAVKSSAVATILVKNFATQLAGGPRAISKSGTLLAEMDILMSKKHRNVFRWD